MDSTENSDATPDLEPSPHAGDSGDGDGDGDGGATTGTATSTATATKATTKTSSTRASTQEIDDEIPFDEEKLERVLQVELPVIVVLAEKEMALEDILSLGKDSVISFNKLNNEPLEFYVNDRLLGNGKAIKVGESFGIYMNRVDSPEEALRKLADDVD